MLRRAAQKMYAFMITGVIKGVLSFEIGKGFLFSELRFVLMGIYIHEVDFVRVSREDTQLHVIVYDVDQSDIGYECCNQ